MLSDYEKERNEKRAVRFDKISAIAKRLELSAGDVSDHSTDYYKLRVNKYVGLGFFYHYGNGKIEVRTISDRAKADCARYESISINVSANRNAISIADDIKRRILNSQEFELNNLALLGIVSERKKADKKEASRVKFLESLGFSRSGESGSSDNFNRYNYSEKCEASIFANTRSDSNKIEISLASESQYRRLARLIAKMHREIESEDEI